MKVTVTKVSNGYLIEPSGKRAGGSPIPDDNCTVVEGDDPKKLGEAVIAMVKEKTT